KVGLIKEVHCLTWVANVVVVKKANRKWMMCVDFTNLSMAYPKDHYPLLTINHLVDVTIGHAVCSLVDAISDYHQILIEPRNFKKIAFIINKGVFYYKVMSYRFKNARMTYQSIVNEMYKELNGKTVEVHVDDMIIKSKNLEDMYITLLKLLMS
ncbi:hypothetical protein P3X46_018239, partial [Hevea brasiliensis]